MPQAAEKEPLAIRFKLARRFYEPILLDAALKNIGGGGSSGPQHEPNSPEDSIDNAEEAFQCFVNRLADVCDNGNFGKTVSAVAVLEEFDCVHYIVGSNMREATGIEAVKSFVKKLLELVGSQGDPSSEKAGLKKMLLSHVLHFNQKRVERYATRMAHHLQECIKDHERRYPENHEGYSDDAAQSLKAQLIPLLQMTQTPTDEQPGRVGLSFFARFDALLQHIHHLDHDAQFKEAISEQAQDGKAFTRQPWIEFKHYFGRLKSYRLAIDTIIHVGRRSPILFQDVRVTVIPSAKPGESVFKGSKTKTNADGIIGRMLSPGPTMSQAQIQTWKDRVAELQKFGLDKSITRQIQGQDSLIVHAEILVLDFVLGYMSRGGTVGFWKGWKYIGSSKPTCRLCHYYMAAHPSRVKRFAKMYCR
ncbi:hypothetical protein ESCO_005779 [Escovopsis weberi]|uniref:Uncharacterized protein n=1 Tax=Escovopsis weberi TaxID=150374 RepID=A0A0M8MZA6_ESCWE|nr:hypothetical protein ESCO_005779 [Escovopsis weberi]